MPARPLASGSRPARRSARRTPALVVVAILAAALQGGARAAEPTARPRVGLVLSGGGARGAAHVGVLRTLEEMRVPVDVIAGTSMGAIVGSLYATGLTPDEIERELQTLDWSDAYEDQAPRPMRSYRRKRDDDSILAQPRLGFGRDGLKTPPGLLHGQRVVTWLETRLAPAAGLETFDELPVPFRAVATDIVTAETVVLGSGSLARAVTASSSIPGLFAPEVVDGRLLVDGGVTDNVPIDVARSLGAEVLIVVDVSTPLQPREKLDSALAILDQLTSILTTSSSRAQIESLGPEDVLLVPDLGDVTTTEFGRLADAVEAGARAARGGAAALAPLAVSEEEHARRATERRRLIDAPPPRVDRVTAVTDAHLVPSALTSRVQQEPGEALDVARLEKDVTRLHGLGLFEEVTWRLDRLGGTTGLVLDAKRTSWGPGFLQFGLSLESDAEGRNAFTVATAYTRPEVNALGGEWRSEARLGEDALLRTELHQPLAGHLHWFVRPAAWASREVRTTFDAANEVVAELRFSEAGFAIEAGREIGRWGEVSLGAATASGEADPIFGPRVAEGGYRDGWVQAQLAADTLDDRALPGRGTLVTTRFVASRPALGADQSYDQVALTALGAMKGLGGSHVLSVELVRTISGTLPPQDLLPLGGFLRLSGLREEQLRGQETGLVRWAWYRRIGRSRTFPFFAGLSLEAGGAWRQSQEITWESVIPAGSLFAGYDSPIGPLFLGFGAAESGRHAISLRLGHVF